jgi:hypothetical protein
MRSTQRQPLTELNLLDEDFPLDQVSQTYEVEQNRFLSQRAESKRKAAECQRNYFATRANGAPRRINHAGCELRSTECGMRISDCGLRGQLFL